MADAVDASDASDAVFRRTRRRHDDYVDADVVVNIVFT